jgi:hypothetical protein
MDSYRRSYLRQVFSSFGLALANRGSPHRRRDDPLLGEPPRIGNWKIRRWDPVLVLPGFLNDDLSTVRLRGLLRGDTEASPGNWDPISAQPPGS